MRSTMIWDGTRFLTREEARKAVKSGCRRPKPHKSIRRLFYEPNLTPEQREALDRYDGRNPFKNFKKKRRKRNKALRAERKALKAAKKQRCGTFKERLDRFGFKDYAEYLASPLWAANKAHFLESRHYHGCCECCGSKQALVIHHRTYRHVCHEQANELIALCRECHSRVHQIEKEQFCGAWKATKILLGETIKQTTHSACPSHADDPAPVSYCWTAEAGNSVQGEVYRQTLGVLKRT